MTIFKDLLHLFYPNICLCCKEHLTTNETDVCLECRHDLPLTNFSNEEENLIEQTFYGRVKIENATALFFFLKKGKIQHLIHQLKYNKQQQVGTFIGNWLSLNIIESQRFKNIDYIIPVPLHFKKLKKRGFNQVTTFGESLSKNLDIPYNTTVLSRISSTKTQSKKIRLDRWKNVQELFFIEDTTFLENKHVLLVDDIITTGATLEACCLALNKTKNVKISIACMAYTK